MNPVFSIPCVLLRTSVVQSVFLLIFIFPFLPPANADNFSGNPAAAEIRALTLAPTRIVWLQELGAVGAQFRLMGLDTEDDRGERAILPDSSDYSRPLLTPRGERVIFSNRKENSISIVNWDGSGLRRLGNGYAVAVWQDPAGGGGMEWVYGGAWATNSDAMFPIQRAPIDQPGQIETVWSQTLVHPDNFQLSADGRRACGVFPWPACGLAELPDRGWKKYGDGCWPSLAPENVGLLWIFDGAHRNLTLCRTDADERWTIKINQAPGIDGFEVYHPRWSNRARIMGLTGPYKLGSGENRIRAGGPAVEIYLGRFDDKFRAIERWVRVTHNSRADFFPDVWVRPDAGSAAKTNLPTNTRAGKTATWPANTAGLVFLWQNRAGKNEIARNAGEANQTCRVEPKGAARYGRYFEMDLSRGIFTAEPGAGALIPKAGRDSDQFSLTAVLTPRQPPRDFSQIIAFSANFSLGQEQDRLIFRLKTGAEESAAIPLCVLTSNAPQQVVINYTSGHLTCSLNGNLALTTNAPRGGLAGWTAGELVFGDRTNFWPGLLDHIALYNRALEEAEIRQGYRALAGELQRRTPAPQLTIAGRLAELTAIPTPAAIAPYRRALAVNLYDNLKPLRGACSERRILVAHWVILDGQVLDSAQRAKGKSYRMILEPFDQHPELEGERLVMESEELLLPLFYEVE